MSTNLGSQVYQVNLLGFTMEPCVCRGSQDPQQPHLLSTYCGPSLVLSLPHTVSHNLRQVLINRRMNQGKCPTFLLTLNKAHEANQRRAVSVPRKACGFTSCTKCFSHCLPLACPVFQVAKWPLAISFLMCDNFMSCI